VPADPADQRLQRDFMALPLPDRRGVIKAVNRGQLVAEPKHARFAVVVARRQQRFWRFAWLLGPALGLLQLVLVDSWEAALLNGLLGTLTLGGLSWFWYSRAVRSEQLNAEVAERRGGRRRPKQERPTASGTRSQPDTGADTRAAGGTDAGPDDRPWWRRLGRRRRSTVATSASSSPSGHLPGEGARPPGPAAGGTTTTGGAGSADPEPPRAARADDGRPPPPGQRPYRPRGHKRRR
jgi:hypothetical protein